MHVFVFLPPETMAEVKFGIKGSLWSNTIRLSFLLKGEMRTYMLMSLHLQ